MTFDSEKWGGWVRPVLLVLILANFLPWKFPLEPGAGPLAATSARVGRASPAPSPGRHQEDWFAFPDRTLERKLSYVGVNAQGFKEYKAADGSVLIHVPGGDFLGSQPPYSREGGGGGVHKLHVGGYYIGKVEVTNAQFNQFARETGFKPAIKQWKVYWEKSGNDYPVVYVTWRAAKAYCRWAGLRLPTVQEWELAARGVHGRRYPWGQEWDANRCNNFQLADGAVLPRRADYSAGRGPLPVGLFPAGASPSGGLDMVGNVAEWCSDEVSTPKAAPRQDSRGFSNWRWRALCGGSWDDFPDRCALAPPVSGMSPE